MKMTVKNLIRELEAAVKTHDSWNHEYGTNDTNHVTEVVKCILDDYWSHVHDREHSEDSEHSEDVSRDTLEQILFEAYLLKDLKSITVFYTTEICYPIDYWMTLLNQQKVKLQ